MYRSNKRGDVERIIGDPSVEPTGKKLKAKYEKFNTIWLKKKRFPMLAGYAHLYIPPSASFK